MFSSSCIGDMQWGHHFNFQNELGIEIDSLSITIGNKPNWLYPSDDSLKTIEGNLTVPENGYPHVVKIFIYHDNSKMQLKADSFDCYNCDGYHQYILRKKGAEYKFWP